MRPEDEALLARVPARRREAVKVALEELELLRQEWKGTPDDKLPPEVLERGQAAALVVRRATEPPVSIAIVAIGLLLAGIGVGLAIFQPVTFYAFSTAGEGSVHCVVRERPLGIFPGPVDDLSGIVSATGESRHTSEVQRDSDGRQHTISKTIQTLSLKDAAGRTLHERTLEYVLGAEFSDVAGRIEQLALGRKPASFVRWATVWPAHLAATLFGFVGLVMLWSAFTDALSWLSLRPFRWLSSHLVGNGIHALLFAILLLAWGIAVVGGDPPGWLVTTLGVGP